jgi:hypothetical protein
VTSTLTATASPIAAFLRWGAVRAALATVSTGLFFIVVSLCLLLFLGGVASGTAGASRDVLAQAWPICLLVGTVLVLAGQFLCSAVPSESGAEGWILGCILCLSLGIIGLVLYFVAGVSNHTGLFQIGQTGAAIASDGADKSRWDPKEVEMLGYTAVAAVLLGELLFVFFLHAVASRFQNSRLAGCLLVTIVVSVLFAGTGVGLAVALGTVPVGTGLFAGENAAVMVGYLVGGILLLACILLQVFLVRDTVARGLLRMGA